MKKQYLIMALSILLIVSLSGCKAKEKIDIDETTVPTSTTQVSTTTAPETIAVSASLEANEATYKEAHITIKFPQLSGLGDETLENQINAIIREAAISGIEGNGIQRENDNASIEYSVKSLNKKMIVIIFSGKKLQSSGTSTISFEYYLTLNLTTGKTVRLTNYISAASLCELLINGSNYQVISDDTVLQSKIKDYITNGNMDNYADLFENADFSGNSSDPFPAVFSYDDNGTIVLRIPVSDDLGGYATLSFVPSTK